MTIHIFTFKRLKKKSAKNEEKERTTDQGIMRVSEKDRMENQLWESHVELKKDEKVKYIM